MGAITMSSMDRRQFLGSAAAICATAAFSAHAAQRRMNVLHIISDDLCNHLGCYGDPMVKSPNIDRLAARGVQFQNAYCQFPLCNPSRASFMTGLRPDTLKLYDNQKHFRDEIPDAVTIAQSFQKAGYSTARVGKIYHYGVPRQIGTDGLDDPASWEQRVNPKGRDIDDIGIVEVLELGPDGNARTVTGKRLEDTGGTLSWLASDGVDSDQTDGKIAGVAIEMLEARAKEDKPFYLAVGFFRPHTPYVAPKKYYDMYPREAIKVPVVAPNNKDLFPAAALATQKPMQLAMSDDLKRAAIQAYSAATTFMDAQVGQLLDALDRLKLTDNTIVIFHGDHGYHLGEKNLWQKMSIFEESARVPLIISVPNNSANGKDCTRPVELVSLHKTLTDLCGIDADSRTEGYSMKPLVKKPNAQWDHAAYSQVTRKIDGKDLMGRSVRTERYRYTEWDEGRAGVELYDHDDDPGEMKNFASDLAHKATVDKMQRLLREGGK